MAFRDAPFLSFTGDESGSGQYQPGVGLPLGTEHRGQAGIEGVDISLVLLETEMFLIKIE